MVLVILMLCVLERHKMTQVLLSYDFSQLISKDTNMNGRFEKVPLESGTRIQSQQEFVIEQTSPPLNALYQHWIWDGIIFSYGVAGLNDDGLFGILTQTTYGKNIKRGGITISRSDSGFTFVNFNFIA